MVVEILETLPAQCRIFYRIHTRPEVMCGKKSPNLMIFRSRFPILIVPGPDYFDKEATKSHFAIPDSGVA